MEALLHIDNAERTAETGGTFERHNPASGKVVTRGAAASVRDAVAAVESCQRAYLEWSKSKPSERRSLLLKVADCIEAKMDEFVPAMKLDIGTSDLWARINVWGAASIFREAASLATQIQGETIPTDKPDCLSMTIRQPVGVCLSIVPWNGPVCLAARAIAYPLVCGNTVVFRASEMSPKTHELIAQAVYDAGMPSGVLNFITNAPEDAPSIVEAMIAHPSVRRINFTGSTAVGRIIAEKAGRHLKRCLLELGDKSPLVVLDDANLEDAVSAAIYGSFLNHGQLCMSTERIIVDQKVADAFVSRFVKRVKELPQGDPATQAACMIGPVISRNSGDRLNALIQDALDKGAMLVVGGRAEGAMLPASVLDHVRPGMRIYSEETFGPVISIIRAKDTDDAVRIANDTEYGLSAGVFGADVGRALSVALRIETGSCHINGSTVHGEAQAPFGGTKASGFGRFDGRAFIDEVTELKWVTIERSGQPYPF